MSVTIKKPFYKSITNILIIIISLCYVLNLFINKEDAFIGVNPYKMMEIGALSHTTPIWTFISSLFVHVSFSHFITNIIMLWLLGHIVEEEYNIYIYITIFFVGGLLGNVLQFLINDNAVISGSSGSVYALLGSFAASLIIDKNIKLQENKLLVLLIIMTIGIGVIYTVIGVNINVMAHLIGLFWGFVFPITVHFTKQLSEKYKIN